MMVFNTNNKDKNNFEFLIRESLKRGKQKEIEQLIAAKKKHRLRSLLRSAAASVVILFGMGLGFILLQEENPKTLVQSYIETTELMPPSEYRSLNDGKEKLGKLLKDAYEAIGEKNFMKAIAYFSAYEEGGTLSDQDKIHYALCILKTQPNALDKSRQLLVSIKNTESGSQQVARYLLGLNEVMLGNDKAAKEIFRELSEISDYKKVEIENITKTLKIE